MSVPSMAVCACAALPFLLSACASDAGQKTEEEILAHAHAIHDEAITIDTHNDFPSNWATPEVDPCADTDLRVDIPKMVAGGLDMTFPVVWVGQGPRSPEIYAEVREEALSKFEAIHRVAEEMCPDKVAIAYRADDVERIMAEGKRAYAIGIENSYTIGNDLSLLETYYDMGGRYITLTHSGHNDIADSSWPADGPQEEHEGLSAFGEEVVREMNRLGMMIDVSHGSDNTVRDVFALSEAPIIASHSSVQALYHTHRNMSDELLLGLKENGGVIQITALGVYLKVVPPEYSGVSAWFSAYEQRIAAEEELLEELGLTESDELATLTNERMAEYDRRMAEIDAQWPLANVSDYVDHIDYVKNLIGVDHVGIGTDFDGGGEIVGLQDATDLPDITTEMVRRGYTDEEIKKIWGGNLLRVWHEVERVASEIQARGS